MSKYAVFRQPPSAIFWLSVLLLPLITALLCRFYFHQQAPKDKVQFFQQSLETMYQRQAQNLPPGSVLFFGDSQIQGLSVTAISPKAVNFGIGHQQLQRLAQTISNYPGLTHADKIVIGIGINDLLQATLSEPEKVIRQLLDALRCCSDKVVLLSVFPVNEIRLQKPGFNQQIQQFNQQLKAAALVAGVRFIDSFTVFADSNGQLAALYDLGDGLHLNATAYMQLIRLITAGLMLSTPNEN